MAALEELLLAYPGAVVLVTHDRYFLDRVVSRIVELEEGQLQVFAGGYGAYLEQKQAQLEAAGHRQERLLNLLRREEAWLQRGAKARTTKQKARKERVARSAGAEGAAEPRRPRSRLCQRPGAGQHRPRLRAARRRPRRPHPGRATSASSCAAASGSASSAPTVAARPACCAPPSASWRRRPGEVVRGQKSRIGYLDQARSGLDDSQFVHEALGEGEWVTLPGGQKRHKIGYLEDFLFSPAEQKKRIATLSGRRAGAAAAGQADPRRGQSAGPRRADQRSRHPDPAGPRRGARRLSRLPAAGDPRPLVSRPGGDRHPPFRGGRTGRGLSGQLPGLHEFSGACRRSRAGRAAAGPGAAPAPGARTPPAQPGSPSRKSRNWKRWRGGSPPPRNASGSWRRCSPIPGSLEDHQALAAVAAELAGIEAELEASAAALGGAGGEETGAEKSRQYSPIRALTRPRQIVYSMQYFAAGPRRHPDAAFQGFVTTDPNSSFLHRGRDSSAVANL